MPTTRVVRPWKKPQPGDINGRPVASVLDEALAPVDRDVFRRQVNYDAQIQTKNAAPAAPAAAR